MRHDDTWAGVEVRAADNPGKRRTVTGRVIGERERLRVEIRFGPNEIVFKPAVVLEREAATRSPIEHLQRGELGTSTDLRRLLTFHKARGGQLIMPTPLQPA